jgi:hypothetical protein
MLKNMFNLVVNLFLSLLVGFEAWLEQSIEVFKGELTCCRSDRYHRASALGIPWNPLEFLGIPWKPMNQLTSIKHL